MSTTVTVLVIYLGILLALAIWSRRETHTLAGFYLADKKLPFWVVAFSTNATGESGWLLLGLSGMGYAVGVQAYWGGCRRNFGHRAVLVADFAAP